MWFLSDLSPMGFYSMDCVCVRCSCECVCVCVCVVCVVCVCDSFVVGSRGIEKKD
jgi:hypothetical protein